MGDDPVYFKPNKNGNNKEEEVVFIPNSSVEKPATEQKISEIILKKRRQRKRNICILKIVATICFLILLVIAGVLAYWALNHEFDQGAPPHLTTAETDTTTYYDMTTIVNQETTTTTATTGKPAEEPVIFLHGPFNFSEAQSACTNIGRTLALKEDMYKAFEKGYERCSYGWLADQHTGYVIQRSGATPACGGGVIGLIYSPRRPVSYKVAGANCAPIPNIYVDGRFNFTEAKVACAEIGRTLASQADMEKAFRTGYEKCNYGWMIEQHFGYVMQESGARPACGGGVVGLIYTNERKPSHKAGANCAPLREQIPRDLYKEPLENHKSIHWWVTTNPGNVYDLKYLLQFEWKSYREDWVSKQQHTNTMMRALRSIFPCCGIVSVKLTPENTTYVKLRNSPETIRSLIATYKKEFGNPNLKVYPQAEGSYESMMVYGAATANRSKTIDDLVIKTLALGVDGLVFDYEPQQNYSREHADSYKIFLDDLLDAFDKHNLKLGVTIAAWGILKYYDIYSQSKVNFLGSMSSTYYGSDLPLNENNVDEMRKWINPSRLQIGLGTMHISDKVEKQRDYRWNSTQLSDFVNFLESKKVKQLHLYPSVWNKIRYVEKYLMESLLDFAKSK